ncbi:MAG: IclR family transcriptional regulator [Pseudomonadota bacterium]
MPTDRVEAVDRAINLLEAFHEPGEDLNLSGLAKRTGLDTTTLLRPTRSLQHFGYLLRRQNGDCRLGPSLWRLGTLDRQDFLPAELVRPVLRDLADVTAETASFYVKDGEERVCLYRANATRALRHRLNEDARLPIDREATGRLLSAYSDPKGEAGEGVRDQGYAVSLGERAPEITAIAVPVFENAGGCASALTISVPVGRFTPDMTEGCIPQLLDAAKSMMTVLPP